MGSPTYVKEREKIKMATFYNQASLSYAGQVTNSNVTEGEILDAFSITKTAINRSYCPGGSLAYVITLTNTGLEAATNVTVTDNLGAYTTAAGITVTPLEYNDGSLLYYQNGVLAAGATVTPGPPLLISGITVPAGGTVTLIYSATANAFAPLESGSSITNTATSSGCGEASATATVTVRDGVELTIAKTICPDSVNCGGEITYTFIIQNTGNIPVVATDNLTVSDTFTHPLANISVTLNGNTLAEGTGYSYDTVTGEFRTLDGAVAVPAATFSTDPTNGVVTVTPGVAVITVKGTL